MDEVDGMAGNEDRGGIQVKLLQLLANAIAKSAHHISCQSTVLSLWSVESPEYLF